MESTGYTGHTRHQWYTNYIGSRKTLRLYGIHSLCIEQSIIKRNAQNM